jgi:hypothetical protein
MYVGNGAIQVSSVFWKWKQVLPIRQELKDEADWASGAAVQCPIPSCRKSKCRKNFGFIAPPPPDRLLQGLGDSQHKLG